MIASSLSVVPRPKARRYSGGMRLGRARPCGRRRPSVRCLPAEGSGDALERAGDGGCDPAPVEPARLRRDGLTVDLAGIHRARIYGDAAGEGLESRGRLRVAPGGSAGRRCAASHVEVAGGALELAVRAPFAPTSAPCANAAPGR